MQCPEIQAYPKETDVPFVLVEEEGDGGINVRIHAGPFAIIVLLFIFLSVPIVVLILFLLVPLVAVVKQKKVLSSFYQWVFVLPVRKSCFKFPHLVFFPSTVGVPVPGIRKSYFKFLPPERKSCTNVPVVRGTSRFKF